MLEIKGKYCKDIKVFTDNIEETALTQIYTISEHRAYDGKKIRIMPDVHAGKGMSVIGFSMPIDIENDYLNPEVVGCDLGCMVSSTFFKTPLEDDKLAEFEHKIRKEIPFGTNINDKSKVKVNDIIKRFNNVMDRLCSMYPQFKDYRVKLHSEADLEAWCKRIRMDYGVFLKSIGTVGGGGVFATV